MTLPNSDHLKAKLSKEVENTDHTCPLQSLKSSLKLAYESVKNANRKSQLNNKILYDRKVELWSFEIGDLVYLYKLSDLNYEIVSLNHEKQTVHINL